MIAETRSFDHGLETINPCPAHLAQSRDRLLCNAQSLPQFEHDTRPKHPLCEIRALALGDKSLCIEAKGLEMQMHGDNVGENVPQSNTYKVSDRLRRFKKDEDGAIVLFSIFMFLAMLMVAGIGVDLMRYERDRSRLQATLDRAVLAAADLDQELDPTDVVNNYFETSNIQGTITSIVPTSGVGYKTVYAAAKVDLNTTFLTLAGIDTLTATADSQAEERIDGVEISLVLDISGSMGSNSRLTNLKPAAMDFVDTVLKASEEGKVSVSIVPYATQVTAGEALLQNYTTTDEHEYSHCVNFDSSDFDVTTLSQDDELERAAHFDVYTYSEDPISRPVCITDEYAEILALSGDQDALDAKIESLQADGNTSIDLGVKWGVALLDPDTNPVVTQMITDGEIDAGFADRPAAYNDSATLKVLVVMSDGQNTSQYMLDSDLRDGNSDVWYNEQADTYSVQKTEYGKTTYWWPDKSIWEDHPYGNGEYEECDYEYIVTGYYYDWRGRYRSTGYYEETCETVDEPGTAVRLEYPELWNRTSLAWNAQYNYTYDSNRWSTWYNNAYDYVGGTTKDTRTEAICDAAKDEGVVIFTVGFEAPDHGQSTLQSCASSDSHHFDVDGLEIDDAFAAIAASIRQLRLTQ